jgi:hypothetical protein
LQEFFVTDDPNPTKRAEARSAARARRAEKVARRQAYFEALASGFSPEQIAHAGMVGVTTVRRELDRAIAERQLDAPDRYIHLQVARLTKALRVVDVRLQLGELEAIAPLTKVVAALDRYHGLSGRYARTRGAPPAVPPASLSAPLLTLTQAAPSSTGSRSRSKKCRFWCLTL